MADEKVTFVLSARDQATATVKRLKGELGAMGGTAAKSTGPLAKLGAVSGGLISPMTLGIGAALGLGTAVLGAAKAAMEEERGVALLTTALKENDPAHASNIKQIEATITERQNLAFADDEQRESLGALIAVTKDSGKALELQRTAMDLARLKGIDLSTASSILGKVYGGNIGILGRYGIQLEKGATATEAIAEIQKRAAGQAEAFAETTAGAMQAAGLAFDDVVEDVGAMLLPALTELATFARDSLIPAMREVGAVIGPILSGIATGVGNLVQSFREAEGDINFFAMNFGEQGELVHGMADRLGVDFDVMKDRIRDAMMAGGGTFKEVTAQMAADAAAAAVAIPARMSEGVRFAAEAIKLGGPVVSIEAGKVAGMFPSEIRARVGEIRAAGRENVVQFAAGLLDAQNDPQVAIDAMVEAQKSTLTRSAEITRLMGQLNSRALAAGLNDERDAVSLAAQAARSEIESRLSTLGVDASAWGANVGGSLAAGLWGQYGVVRDAAGGLAAAVRGQIAIRSEPPDGDSPLRGITKWGGNIAKTMAGGLVGELGVLRQAAGAAAGALVPAGPVATGARAGAGAGGGGAGTITINVNAPLGTDAAAASLARLLTPAIRREWSRQRIS